MKATAAMKVRLRAVTTAIMILFFDEDFSAIALSCSVT
jgi:hypothetical protein